MGWWVYGYGGRAVYDVREECVNQECYARLGVQLYGSERKLEEYRFAARTGLELEYEACDKLDAH